MFYLIVEEGTLIDWWIVTRETAFILVYLIAISYFLYGNEIKMEWAIILIVLYVLHIFLMKYSSKYEISIKKKLAIYLEKKELNRIGRNEIHRFHRSLKNQAVSIEMLNKINFELIDGFIVFKDSGIKVRLEPIVCVKLGEEQFAEHDDIQLMSRLRFKRTVTKIIIKLQAYKVNTAIQSTFECRQHLNKIVPLMPDMTDQDDSDFGYEYYAEDDDDSTIEINRRGSQEITNGSPRSPNIKPKKGVRKL